MTKKLIIAAVIVVASVVAFAVSSRAQFRPCVWPNTCAQVQPCVWPNTCAKPVDIVYLPIETCVWPHTCKV